MTCIPERFDRSVGTCVLGLPKIDSFHLGRHLEAAHSAGIPDSLQWTTSPPAAAANVLVPVFSKAPEVRRPAGRLPSPVQSHVAAWTSQSRPVSGRHGWKGCWLALCEKDETGGNWVCACCDRQEIQSARFK
jgi:hypothetical protein